MKLSSNLKMESFTGHRSIDVLNEFEIERAMGQV